MFNKENFADEIAKSMAKSLAQTKIASKGSFDDVTKAIDFLQAAAEIFDNTGFYAEAEEVTTFLEKMASKKKVK